MTLPVLSSAARSLPAALTRLCLNEPIAVQKNEKERTRGEYCERPCNRPATQIRAAHVGLAASYGELISGNGRVVIRKVDAGQARRLHAVALRNAQYRMVADLRFARLPPPGLQQVHPWERLCR